MPHGSAGSELLVPLMRSGLHRPCQSTWGALSCPSSCPGWGRWDSVEPVPTEGIVLQAAPGREPGFLSSPFCCRREDRARGGETEAQGPVLASLRELTLLRGLLTPYASQLDNEETQDFLTRLMLVESSGARLGAVCPWGAFLTVSTRKGPEAGGVLPIRPGRQAGSAHGATLTTKSDSAPKSSSAKVEKPVYRRCMLTLPREPGF